MTDGPNGESDVPASHTPGGRTAAPAVASGKGWLATALLVSAAFSLSVVDAAAQDDDRPRARDLGIVVGVFEPGEHNAITDL